MSWRERDLTLRYQKYRYFNVKVREIQCETLVGVTLQFFSDFVTVQECDRKVRVLLFHVIMLGASDFN